MVVFLKKNINANAQPQPPLAFGSRAPRFGKQKMDTKDLKSDGGCDPCNCHYQPTPMNKVDGVGKNTAMKDSWRQILELEEWSKNLGYKNPAILEERRFRATCGGPATCDIKEINTDFSRRKNTGFGTTPRFKTVKFVTPAPGTYNKPLTPLTAPHVPPSNKQPFDFVKPAGLKVSSRGLAPNRYTIVDKDSIEMKSKKLVSLRGPYDLFTGPRDNTTIKNHFGSNKRDYCPSWPMAFPDCFERLKKSHFGEMNKTGRESRSKPGLAVHNLNPLTVFKQNKVPFLSSDDRPRGLKLAGLSYPGVGRYDIQSCMCTNVPGNGHKHVFLSKVPRTSGSYIKPPLNSF